MAGSEFDKDFGYLMPFLDKVAAAASEVSNQAAREELAQLVDGEKERWSQIRKLLSGDGSGPDSLAPSKAKETISEEKEKPASPAPTPPKVDEPESVSEEEPTAPSLSDEETMAQPSLQFTVGSLRPRKR